MDFRLSEEQELMVETAARIGTQFGLAYWRALDAAGEYPSEMWQAICDAGLSGVALAEEHGGAGLGMLDMALIVEALTAARAAGAVVSFDLNFRNLLWKKRGSREAAQETLRKIVGLVDVVVGNEEDLQQGLGIAGPDISGDAKLDTGGFL